MPLLTGGRIGLMPNVDPEASVTRYFMKWLEERGQNDNDPAKGKKYWVRPSNSGKCARQIGFKQAGIEEDLPMEPLVHWTFFVGDTWHYQLQQVLDANGYESEIEIDLIDEFGLVAHVDSYNAELREVVEIKSQADTGFMFAVGLRQSGSEGPGPSYDHVIQAAVGAWALTNSDRPVDWMRIIYINKNQAMFGEWLIPMGMEIPVLQMTPWQAAEQEIRRQHKIHERVQDGLLPRRHIPTWGDVIDPPSADDRGQPWQCRYCAFQPTCKKLPVEPVSLDQVRLLKEGMGEAV